MRFMMSVIFVLILTCPAYAAFRGPSAATAPAATADQAVKAEEHATCVLQGRITEHLSRDRYTFKDDTGSIQIAIAPHVFGSLEVGPEDTVRVTGEMAGKKKPDRLDPHLRVRYIEILK